MLLGDRAMGDGTFARIVDENHAEIHRYLGRVASRGGEADDLLQETFVRAFRTYRSLPADANVRVWLFAIATQLCRNHFRLMRRRRAARQAGQEAPRATDGDEPAGGARAAGGWLEEMIGHIPVKQRLAFTMRKLHDLDYDAIGESLDCSAERARTHVFQALRRIRRGLEGSPPPRGGAEVQARSTAGIQRTGLAVTTAMPHHSPATADAVLSERRQP